MAAPSDWMTSARIARYLRGRRDNDIRVDVNGVYVPIRDVHYDSLEDVYVVDLIDGEDLRVALTTDPPPARGR